MGKKITESSKQDANITLHKKSGSDKVSKVSSNSQDSAAPKTISAPKPASLRRGSKGELRKGKAIESSIITSVADKSPSDIIYIGHIPAGFEEKEMRKFFTQFGDVVRLKLVRNKKTLASRGHAFIKFNNVDTAVTVSESMNGYFIGERQLVSHVVPRNKVHEGMLRTGARNANKDVKSADNRRKRKADADESSDSDSEVDIEPAIRAPKSSQQIDAALRKKQRKLTSLGINYEFLDAIKSNSMAFAEAESSSKFPPSPPMEIPEAEQAPQNASKMKNKMNLKDNLEVNAKKATETKEAPAVKKSAETKEAPAKKAPETKKGTKK
jgi:nucleolar protein 15